MTDVTVTRNPDRSRYEAHVDGALAGFAEYELRDGLIVFPHTEVDPAFEGRGVAGALARNALDEVRSEGSRRVRPVCPFFKGWIEKHPDYEDLLERRSASPRT